MTTQLDYLVAQQITEVIASTEPARPIHGSRPIASASRRDGLIARLLVPADTYVAGGRASDLVAARLFSP